MTDPGGFQIDPRYLPSLQDTMAGGQKRNLLRAGISSGIDQLQGLFGSAIQGTGRLTGLDGVEAFGQRMAERNAIEAQQNGRPDLEIAPWKENGAPVLKWLGYQTAKQIPTLAGYAAATALTPAAAVPTFVARAAAAAPKLFGGAGLGRAAAAGLSRGALAETGAMTTAKLAVGGTGAFGMPVAFGSMVQEAAAKPGGLTTADAAKAAALSPFYAAVDLAEPAFLKGAFTHGTSGKLASRIVKKSLQGSAMETVQEGIQTAMEQSFRDDLTPQDRMSNIVEAAVTGGAVGGVFGGIGGLRAIKRMDASQIDTNMLDEVTSMVDPEMQQKLLTSTMYTDSAGRAAPGADQLTNGSNMLEYTTLQQPKQGSLRWAQPYEQAPADTPFAAAPTQELVNISRVAAEYLANLPEDHRMTSRDVKVQRQLELINAELATRNDFESKADVASTPVEAVEPSKSVLGAAGAQAVPASAKPTFSDRVAELKKGLRLPGQFAASISGVKDENELLSKVHREIFERQDTRPTVQKYAQRLGLLDEQLNPTPLADAMGARLAEPVEAPVEVDPVFETRWAALIGNTRDKTIRALKPVNEEDAVRKVYRELSSNRGDPLATAQGPSSGQYSDRLEKLGRDLGLLDDDNRPTKRMVDLSRENIPLKEATDAAMDRGFKGAEVSQFDRGARWTSDKKPKFDDTREAMAFVAGQEWANPDVQTEQETQATIKDMDLGANFVAGSKVPDEQRRQRWLNQAIDLRYDPLFHPEENAQLKQLVREGDDGTAIDEAERYLKSGRGALVNAPAPVRPRDPNVRDTQFGQTYRPDPSVKSASESARDIFRQEQAVKQLGEEGRARSAAAAIRRHERKEAVRNELMASLRLAAENREIAGGDYIKLRKAIDANDFERVKNELTNLGAKPYHYFSDGTVEVTPMDRFAARQLAYRVLDGDGKARSFMANLALQPGYLGQMARRFAQYVPENVTIDMVSNEDMADIWEEQGGKRTDTPVGLYVPTEPAIYISLDANHPAIFMHEIVHSIVGSHIFHNTPIGREIKSIYNRFKKLGPRYDYAFTNADEFMAEFLSRQQVRDYVRDWSRQRKAGGLFARLWELVRIALGKPPRDYVERLLQLAEAAGAKPISDRSGRTMPRRMSETVRDRFQQVAQAADRREDARGGARKLFMGFATIHDIAEYWGKWFGTAESNPVKDFENHLNQKQSIVARMAQMMTTARDQVDYMLRTANESGKALVRLMTLSEFGIDPTKTWDKQSTMVRDHKNKANLEKIHAEAHKLYNDQLVRKGFAGVYQNLRNVNDVLMMAQMSVSLRSQIVADTWASKELDHFAVGPMDRFMEAQEREDFTPELAREWWANELNTQLSTLDTYVKRYRDHASKLGVTTKDDRMRAEIEQRMDPVRTRVTNIRQTLQQMDDAPYFHLGRFGNYFVGWHVVDQEVLGKVADYLADKGFGAVISRESDKINAYMRVENQRQQADLLKAIEELEAQGLIEPKTVVSGKRTEDVVRNGLADEWFERMVADIEANEDLDKKAKAAAIEALRDLHLDLMPENSLSRVMTHREGVPGFDADMMRAFEHRANVGINALAGMVISPKVTQAFTDMRKREDEAQHKPSSEVSIDQRNGMTMVIDELSQRERERPQWPETKLLDQLRAVNHAWFLGGSVSYGLVNLTQLGATLLPELGARHGFVKTAKVMGQVTPIALRIIREVWKEGYGVSVSRAMDAVITRSVLEKAGLKGAQAEFIMRVANSGQLDIGGPSRELMRASEGRADEKVDTVLRYASSIGYYTETLSRLVAALSSYELNPGKGDVAKAAERAVYVLKETMWDYSSANQGRQFGKMGVFGKVTPLATAFMQYTAQLTGKLYRETYEAIKGDTAPQRAEARRFLRLHLGAMTVLAGTLGLPMASVLAATMDRLKDLFDDDETPSDVRADWRNFLSDTFGADVGEMISRGAFRGLGIDIASRVGEQDILPFSRMLADRRNFKDSIKDMQARSWGAPSSMVVNFLSGGEAIANGDILGGMIKMLPNALSAPAKAFKLTEDGYTDAAGNKLPMMSPGAEEILAQAIGFNPSVKAEYSEARGTQSVRKGQLTRNATVLREEIIKAVTSNDREAARDAIQRAQEFDRTNPAFAVLPDISSAIERRLRARAVAAATRTPLGTSLKDLSGRDLTRYANIEYQAR
jgi:hypothetical protein